MKILERKGGKFDVVSSVDPRLTLVTFTTRRHAEDYVRRRSTNAAQARLDRPRTSTPSSATDGPKHPSWGYSGRN